MVSAASPPVRGRPNQPIPKGLQPCVSLTPASRLESLWDTGACGCPRPVVSLRSPPAIGCDPFGVEEWLESRGICRRMATALLRKSGGSVFTGRSPKGVSAPGQGSRAGASFRTGTWDIGAMPPSIQMPSDNPKSPPKSAMNRRELLLDENASKYPVFQRGQLAVFRLMSVTSFQAVSLQESIEDGLERRSYRVLEFPPLG